MKLNFKTILTMSMALALWSALSARAQTSIALSALGSFPSTTTTTVQRQTASDQAGFMVELRHISNPLVGYDVSYTFNRANQNYEYTGPTPLCPLPACSAPEQPVHANAHTLTLNYVVSLPILDFRVFALGGGGFQHFSPTNNPNVSTQSQTKGVFDYGAGLDWTVLPHLGLRFQYRGYVYKAPQLATAFSSTDKFTHDAEPMIGAYFNF
ncbi:MAG: porin family protein [Acidobacteria bacterium]|jgi:opacity protein-like surface antigen|nr:porin family protein [Acidobacteriota bacterium]